MLYPPISHIEISKITFFSSSLLGFFSIYFFHDWTILKRFKKFFCRYWSIQDKFILRYILIIDRIYFFNRIKFLYRKFYENIFRISIENLCHNILFYRLNIPIISKPTKSQNLFSPNSTGTHTINFGLKVNLWIIWDLGYRYLFQTQKIPHPFGRGIFFALGTVTSNHLYI